MISKTELKKLKLKALKLRQDTLIMFQKKKKHIWVVASL